MEQLLTFFTAAGLALIHLFAGKLRFLEGIPRSRWLSLAGGVSVAYVFLHLLPELTKAQEALGERLSFLEQRSYLFALIGLAVFYGLERAAKESRQGGKGGEDDASSSVFWLHVFSFALYNLIVGYLLLHREESGLRSLRWYFIAMALHFVVNDFGLREHHKGSYHSTGRWFLAAAVLAGWGLGLVVEVSETLLNLLFAFLAGGVVLNVLKEELPEERKSSFWAFALGAAGYATLLLLT